MRRISIVLALSTVLPVSGSAQQPTNIAVLDLNRDNRTQSDSALFPTGDSTPAIRNTYRAHELPVNGSPALLMPSSPDDWNGGPGNWSNPGNWSAGAPEPAAM
jgi:hypothetical protein